MSEMIERVARAMHADLVARGYTAPFAEDEEIWRRFARAAIAAMRESTEAMIDAMDAIGYHQTCGRQFARRECAREWNAAIDSALTEQP